MADRHVRFDPTVTEIHIYGGSDSESDSERCLTPSPPPYQGEEMKSAPTTHLYLPLNTEQAVFPFFYNVSRDPTKTLALPAYIDLGASAFMPTRRTAELVVDGFPWSIDVTAAAPSGFVTVGDILGGVYSSLRQLSTETDYLSLDRLDKEKINHAFLTRCMESPIGIESERKLGLRRMDFLRGHLIFKGLSSAGQGDVWNLHLAIDDGVRRF